MPEVIHSTLIKGLIFTQQLENISENNEHSKRKIIWRIKQYDLMENGPMPINRSPNATIENAKMIPF